MQLPAEFPFSLLNRKHKVSIFRIMHKTKIFTNSDGRPIGVASFYKIKNRIKIGVCLAKNADKFNYRYAEAVALKRAHEAHKDLGDLALIIDLAVEKSSSTIDDIIGRTHLDRDQNKTIVYVK